MSEDAPSNQINELFARLMDDVQGRLDALEQWRGLSRLNLGSGADSLNAADEVSAQIALAEWRLARLETFHARN